MKEKISSFQILQHVMEFENHLRRADRVTLFEKIGRPLHFKSSLSIPDDEIEHEWDQLKKYMNSHGVDLDFCSPNVRPRDLYQFTLEELFFQEIENVSMDGMMTCFIYDEFHPDYVYENTRIALDDCILYFFEKNSFYDHHYAGIIQLNQYGGLTKTGLKQVVNNFKQRFDQIMPVHMGATECTIEGDDCVVKGLYEIVFMIRGKSLIKKGDWKVRFLYDHSTGYWDITHVHIGGIDIC